MAVQIFPLDVTEYDAAALGAWESTRTRGVYSAENEYAVTAAGGMALSVAAGRAWLKMNDFWGLNATNFEAVTLTVATPNGSLPRIDAVCLRIDKVANAPELLIKIGTPAASPAIPAITQGSTSYDEIYLATVYVGAGVTAITQANITDQRLNEKYCGLMRDGVTSIPTQVLYDAWWAWFSSLQTDAVTSMENFTAWVTAFKRTAKDDFTVWVDASKDELNVWYTAFVNTATDNAGTWYNIFTERSESEFNTWFDNLKNQLDDNQAANLQNQIDKHKAESINSETGVHNLRYVDGKLQCYIGTGWVTVATAEKGILWEQVDAFGLTWEELDLLVKTWEDIENMIITED